MKHGWIILGMVLLLIASVGILIYLLTQMTMSLPLALLLWALVFGIFALVGGIAWLAGWLPRKEEKLKLHNQPFLTLSQQSRFAEKL